MDEQDKLECALEAIEAHVKGTEAIHNWYRKYLPDSWILNDRDSGQPFGAQMALSCFLMEHALALLNDDKN